MKTRLFIITIVQCDHAGDVCLTVSYHQINDIAVLRSTASALSCLGAATPAA